MQHIQGQMRYCLIMNLPHILAIMVLCVCVGWGWGVHVNELLTCNSVFSADFKPFFDFFRQIRSDELKARHELEKDLPTFNDVTAYRVEVL